MPKPKNPDGLPYRYVPATYDFGPSPVPKEGIVLHMAEGSRVVEYLSSHNIVRNVSANFAITTDGEVVQMLPLGHTSGSLNPRDVRTSNDRDGFWGRRFTRYYDPDILTGRANQRTISIECAGFAKDGPNAKQQIGIRNLVAVLRARYKRPIGFNGHADFADYKSCPGKSPAIQAILAVVGHGREDIPVEPPPDDPCLDIKEELAATKAKLEDAEDTIADAIHRLGKYAPTPNQGG